MDIQCKECKQYFARSRNLENHQLRNCICEVDHLHNKVCKVFDSIVEAQNFMDNEEFDSIFKVSWTKPEKDDYMIKRKQVTLKQFNCRVGKKLNPICPAKLKLTKSRNYYVVIGCLTHNHDLTVKNKRISKQVRNVIHGLLRSGLSPQVIKDLHFSYNEDETSRLVSLKDIRNIKQSIPDEEIECNPTHQRNKLKFLPVLDFIDNRVQMIRANPDPSEEDIIWARNCMKTAPSIYHKSGGKKYSGFFPTPFKSKKMSLVCDDMTQYSFDEILQQAMGSDVDEFVWYTLLASNQDEVIFKVTAMDPQPKTHFISKYLKARMYWKCDVCTTYSIEKCNSGFISCSFCLRSFHQSCIEENAGECPFKCSNL